MIDKKVVSAIKDANVQYEAAKKANLGVGAKKQVLCNILLSHVEEIIETALDAEFLVKNRREMEEKIVVLQKKLDAAANGTAEPEASEGGKPVEKKNG